MICKEIYYDIATQCTEPDDYNERKIKTLCGHEVL